MDKVGSCVKKLRDNIKCRQFSSLFFPAELGRVHHEGISVEEDFGATHSTPVIRGPQFYTAFDI